MLLRTQRRHQHRPGGHHGHGRPGRRADDEVPAGQHPRLRHDSAGGPGRHRPGRRVLPAAGGGRHQLQGGPDPGGHRYEPSGHGGGHGLCQGHEHRRERG